MNKKNVSVIIEASSTGFGAYTNDLPGITGYGKTVADAKEDFIVAASEVLEGVKLDVKYKYDLVSIFQHLSFLDVSMTAKRIGINSSLLRQYKSGITPASEKQKERKKR